MRRKALTVLMAFMVLAVAAEFSLRSLFGLGSPSLAVADPDVGYYFAANQSLRRFGNTIAYNEYHMRSEPLKANPSYRILMVGDSVTNGGALTDQKDTIPEILEQKLNERMGSEGEVLSASAGNWGLENECQYLRKFGTFNASLIILQVDRNDLYEAKAGSDVVGTEDFPAVNPPAAISEFLGRYVFHRVFQEAPKESGAGVYQSRVLANIDCVRGIASLAKEKNVTLMVLFVPGREEIGGGRNPEENRLFLLLEENNVSYVDLLDTKYGLQKNEFRDQWHPSVQGNQRIAQALYDTLLASKNV